MLSTTRSTFPAATVASDYKTTDPSHVVKTPAASIRMNKSNRRALGDISNIKQAVAATTHKIKGLTATTLPTKQTQPTSVASKAVSFAIPADENLTQSITKPRTAAVKSPGTPYSSKNKVSITFDEDIELPAGRLWNQEPWIDDDASSVELSLEGAKTARDEILAILDERRQQKIDEANRDDEIGIRAVEKQIENLLLSIDMDTFGPTLWDDDVLLPEEDQRMSLTFDDDDDDEASSFRTRVPLF